MTGMKWQNCEYKSELLRKYIITRNFQQRTWIKMCHILSSENRVPFSFKELKCSPRGAPSTNSIIIYSLSSVKQTSAPKVCPKFLRNNLSYEIADISRHATTGFPAKWRLRNDCRNSILMMCHYLDLCSASDWSCHQRICFNQSEAPSRSGEWHVISMEFLQSFLSLHFKVKPVMALRNVGCFLKLEIAPCENNEEEVYSFKSDNTTMKCSLTRQLLIWGVQRPLTSYSYLAKADMLKTCAFVVTFHDSNYDLSLPVPGSEIVG